MANGKEKIKKITLKNILNPTTTPTGKPTTLKNIYDKRVCGKKGGKWVQGKCIPGSQIRTGKKKYPSKSPERASYISGRRKGEKEKGRAT